MSETAPAMTVVIVVGEKRERAALCLGSVLSQAKEANLEVILIDCDADQAAIEGASHPAVRLVPVPSDTSHGEALALGVREARAPIVGFLEEHCQAGPGWAKAVIAAFDEGPWTAVGTTILPGESEGLRGAAQWFARDSRWLPPLDRGETRQVDGHNATYRRDALLALGDRLAGLLEAETVMLQTLLRDGSRFFAEPAACLRHANERSAWRFTRGMFLWNRIFGHQRAAAFRWSGPYRLLRASAALPLPWWRVARQTADICLRRRALLGKYLLCLPLILVFEHAQALGQAAGFLLGPGRAIEAFAQVERSAERW